MTHEDQEGNGAHMIAARIGRKGTKLRSKDGILDCKRTRPVRYIPNWLAGSVRPCLLLKTTTQQVFVSAKSSRLTDLPHIVVAGMTPSSQSIGTSSQL